MRLGSQGLVMNKYMTLDNGKAVGLYSAEGGKQIKDAVGPL